MKPRLRLIVWSGMPDPAGLALAAERVGRELEVSTISSNEDLERILDQDSPFDLICPSDYLVEKLVRQDRLMDFSGFTGIDRDVLSGWSHNPAYDPEERFSVPLAFGTTGLLYSESSVPSLDSWQPFFEPDGIRVGVLRELREVIGAALILAGHSPNATDPGALADAEKILMRQRPSVDSVTSDEFTLPVENGLVAVHHAWSGPAAIAVRRTPGLAYSVPLEGALLWVTTAAIPVDAPDPDGALELLRELMKPEIASLAVTSGGYSSPNEKAHAMLPEVLSKDRVLFPSSEEIERCLTVAGLTPEEEADLQALWVRYEGS